MPSTNGTGLKVGVIGIGSMGQHHARVYESLPEAELVGITDSDTDRAAEIAADYDTAMYGLDELLDRVTAVSLAVPTQYHFDLATRCLHAGVDILIEKPIADSVAEGNKLVQLAESNDCLLQVGHIERFNPAVEALQEFVDELNIVSLQTERLGPPPDRQIEDSAVIDLMIHDIDIVLSLLGESPRTVAGAGVRQNRHATATLTFGSNTIANLTASRLTQKKVRKLDVVAEECLVRVDYMSKDIKIHRHSQPEYFTDDANLRYRHESIIEQPMVDSVEPLVNELTSFLDVIAERSSPVVDGADGVQALHLAKQIDQFRVEDNDDVSAERDTSTSPEVRLD